MVSSSLPAQPEARSNFACVLFDLDGVLRHFDADHAAGVERRYGLAPGALPATGMASDLLGPMTTGRLTRAEWTNEVGERVGSIEAAQAWTADIGTPDEDMLLLVDELRQRKLFVAILTNGTDTVRAELTEHGIDGRVDKIFNSAEIGVAKPDPAAFRYVSDDLGIDPQQVFFVDDTASKLAGAIEIGMTAHHFTEIGALRTALAAHHLI